MFVESIHRITSRRTRVRRVVLAHSRALWLTQLGNSA